MSCQNVLSPSSDVAAATPSVDPALVAKRTAKPPISKPAPIDNPTPITKPLTRRVKRRKINRELPADSVVISDDVPLIPGVLIHACYGSWQPVTVVVANDDGTVRLNWHNWRSSTYDMLREDLIIKKSVLSQLQRHAAGEDIDMSEFHQAIEDIKKVSISRREIRADLPADHVQIVDKTPLVAGAKVFMNYHGKWESVTVALIRDDGTLRVNQDSYSSYNLDMVREDLVISNDELARIKKR